MNNYVYDLEDVSKVPQKSVHWGEGMDSHNHPKTTSETQTTNERSVTKTVSGSVSEATSSQDSFKPINIDATALIKIIKHCKEAFPTPVNGMLLGLDQPESLEITDCFGLQNDQEIRNQLTRDKMDSREIDEKVRLENYRYQVKMLSQLSLVSADCNTVGWYQTLQQHDLKDCNIVENLCEHQELIPGALCIGFDPQLAHLGTDAFKAFRVTKKFLVYRSSAESTDVPYTYSRLDSNDVLVEVPLFVKSSLLVQSFLNDYLQVTPSLHESQDLITIIDPLKRVSLEKNLNFIYGCLDDFQLEQEKFLKFQKEYVRQNHKQKEMAERLRLENEQRRLRNEELLPEIPATLPKVGEPSHLPTLLMCNQVNMLSKKMDEAISDSVCWAYLLERDLRT